MFGMLVINPTMKITFTTEKFSFCSMLWYTSVTPTTHSGVQNYPQVTPGL